MEDFELTVQDNNVICIIFFGLTCHKWEMDDSNEFGTDIIRTKRNSPTTSMPHSWWKICEVIAIFILSTTLSFLPI